MKFKDLQNILNSLGYSLIRNSNHKIYSNGTIIIAVPHTKDVNKILSKHILKQVGYKK